VVVGMDIRHVKGKVCKRGLLWTLQPLLLSIGVVVVVVVVGSSVTTFQLHLKFERDNK
jgi:hypothetical protein